MGRAFIVRRGGGGGGGGLDLTVVGGTTQPTDVKNNTLWINTETEIGDVYLAPTAPENPIAGDVWVNTSNRYQSDATAIASTTHLLEVKKDPFLRINVLQFKQWDGDEWVRCDGGIYANNAWTDMALYIYWYGTQNEAYPLVGYRSTKNNSTSSTDPREYFDDHFKFAVVSSAVYGILHPEAGHFVDASAFTKIGVKVKTSSSKHSVIVGFSNDITSEKLTYSDALNAQQTNIDATTTLTEYIVDITCEEEGPVRPALGFCGGMSGASSSACTYSVYYWVLT